MAGCGGSEYRFGNSKPADHTLLSVTVNPSAQSLTASGQTAQFLATGNYTVAPLSQDVTAPSQWSSSAPTVATVSAGGVVTAVGTGTATISATYYGTTGSATVTVELSSPPPTRTLTSMAVVPSSQTAMTVGEPGQFLAIGNYSAAPLTQDLTTQATWTSSDTAVAIVNNAGLTTAVSVGNATISAMSGGVVGTSTATVTTNSYPHQLTAITIIPAIDVQTVQAQGETAQYIAIGSFLGSPTTQDMTNQVTWISSDVRVATINSAGLATAVGSTPEGGQTTITALATSSTGVTVTGTSNLTVISPGVNNLPSLTVYMFGQGKGDVGNQPPPPNAIQCGPDYPQAGCTGHFTLNTPVILTASHSAGSLFGGFSANCTPYPDPSPNACIIGTDTEPWVKSCSCQITMGDNQTVGAIFDLQH